MWYVLCTFVVHRTYPSMKMMNFCMNHCIYLEDFFLLKRIYLRKQPRPRLMEIFNCVCFHVYKFVCIVHCKNIACICSTYIHIHFGSIVADYSRIRKCLCRCANQASHIASLCRDRCGWKAAFRISRDFE